MDEAIIRRAEFAIDAVAAAIMSVAAAWAASHAAGPGASLGAGFAVLAIAFAGLRRVDAGTNTFGMAHFSPADVDIGELILTEADIDPESAPLLLEDELVRADPDSRVVQLFDASAMPTPGELKQRIDRHLADPRPPADASRELFDALEDLRRSLR